MALPKLLASFRAGGINLENLARGSNLEGEILGRVALGSRGVGFVVSSGFLNQAGVLPDGSFGLAHARSLTRSGANQGLKGVLRLAAEHPGLWQAMALSRSKDAQSTSLQSAVDITLSPIVSMQDTAPLPTASEISELLFANGDGIEAASAETAGISIDVYTFPVEGVLTLNPTQRLKLGVALIEEAGVLERRIGSSPPAAEYLELKGKIEKLMAFRADQFIPATFADYLYLSIVSSIHSLGSALHDLQVFQATARPIDWSKRSEIYYELSGGKIISCPPHQAEMINRILSFLLQDHSGEVQQDGSMTVTVSQPEVQRLLRLSRGDIPLELASSGPDMSWLYDRVSPEMLAIMRATGLQINVALEGGREVITINFLGLLLKIRPEGKSATRLFHNDAVGPYQHNLAALFARYLETVVEGQEPLLEMAIYFLTQYFAAYPVNRGSVKLETPSDRRSFIVSIFGGELPKDEIVISAAREVAIRTNKKWSGGLPISQFQTAITPPRERRRPAKKAVVQPEDIALPRAPVAAIYGELDLKAISIGISSIVHREVDLKVKAAFPLYTKNNPQARVDRAIQLVTFAAIYRGYLANLPTGNQPAEKIVVRYLREIYGDSFSTLEAEARGSGLEQLADQESKSVLENQKHILVSEAVKILRA